MKPRWYQEEAVKALLGSTKNSVIVLPTASGKSLVLKMYAERYDGKVLILTHVKELIEQNFETLSSLPDVGIYSAGVGIKHIARVTVAGIQSVWNKPELFRDFDKILIDEAHLVNNEGMYKSFLDEMGVQFLGLTATDFRLKGGYIHGESGMFDNKVYDAPVDKLTKQGYLAPLVYFGDNESFDTEGIRTTGGDFNIKDLSVRFNRSIVTTRIVDQIAKQERNHILCFCIDIDHAEEVARHFNSIGVTAAAVHSKSNRDQAILDFKAGKIRVLANVNVLTTGFNYPELDMIAVLRPTKSMGLHIQMLGRGARTHPTKDNTLIKDFTNNTKTLGTLEEPAPINAGVKKGKGGTNPFMKECPDCLKICHPSVRVCECGHKFKFQHGLQLTAHSVKLKKKWYDVTAVHYSIHNKPGSPKSFKVSYVSGVNVFNEWVLLDHPGYAGHKARYWVSKRFTHPKKPTSVHELHEKSQLLKRPRKILVEEGGKFPKIESVV